MERVLIRTGKLQTSILTFLLFILGALVLALMYSNIPRLLWKRTGPLAFPMIFLGGIFFGNIMEAIYLKFIKNSISEVDIKRLEDAILNAGSLLAHAGFLGTVWGIMLSMGALGKNGNIDPPQVLSALALAVTTTLVGSGLDHIGRLFVIYVLGGSVIEED